MKEENSKSPVLWIGGLAKKGDELSDFASRLSQRGFFTFLYS